MTIITIILIGTIMYYMGWVRGTQYIAYAVQQAQTA